MNEHYKTITRIKSDDIKLVNERNFKINPLKVFTKAEKVEDVEAFVPNYLRITEAEYNLEHNND